MLPNVPLSDTSVTPLAVKGVTSWSGLTVQVAA
jgi:hypothetical protein